MNEHHTLAALVALLLVGTIVPACTHARNVAEATAYEEEQRACVEHASTRADADACRCAVKARFERPCDAGADR